MIVWLWTAGDSRLGVTDDEARARRAAEECIRDGAAHSARVERAAVVLASATLTSDYERTGHGWAAAQCHRDGLITWVPFPEPLKRAAS